MVIVNAKDAIKEIVNALDVQSFILKCDVSTVPIHQTKSLKKTEKKTKESIY